MYQLKIRSVFVCALIFNLSACGGGGGGGVKNNNSPAAPATSSLAASKSASSSSSVVQAPEALAGICVDNGALAYAAPHVYFWSPVPSGSVDTLPAWPGAAMTRKGSSNIYCYDFTASLTSEVMPSSMNIIFNNTLSLKTADLIFTHDKGCYLNAAWVTLEACGVTEALPISSASSESSSASTNNSSSSSSSSSSNSSNGASGTSVDNRICFNVTNTSDKANATTSSWTQANIYWFGASMNTIKVNPAWPGFPMTKTGNYYCYDFTSQLTGASMPSALPVIFNNKGQSDAQTIDLQYSAAMGACYQNNAWTTLSACGLTVK